MATKNAKLTPEKDADLLKAVIKANGGVNCKGAAFWKDVVNFMDEDLAPDAARKRFDKFKPSAAKSVKSTTPEKDADLLKAVIRANGGISGKGVAFWQDVVGHMDEDLAPDAARKRFDKFKAKGRAGGAGGEGEDVAAGDTVKKSPRKKAPSKPKVVRGTGKGKKAVDEVKRDDGEEGVPAAKWEDDGQDGEEVETAPEKKVKKVTESRKAKAVKDFEITKTEANITKKRDRDENISSAGADEDEGGEDQLVVETPRPVKKARPTKAWLKVAVDDDYEGLGHEV